MHDIKALETVTHSRLLYINSIIRTNRNIMNKECLRYYKNKRKETDSLLSEIKKLTNTDTQKYNHLKQLYFTFEIDDSRFLEPHITIVECKEKHNQTF